MIFQKKKDGKHIDTKIGNKYNNEKLGIMYGNHGGVLTVPTVPTLVTPLPIFPWIAVVASGCSLFLPLHLEPTFSSATGVILSKGNEITIPLVLKMLSPPSLLPAVV